MDHSNHDSSTTDHSSSHGDHSTTDDSHSTHGDHSTTNNHSSHGGHHDMSQSLEDMVKEINQKNKTYLRSKEKIKVLIIKDDNPFSDNYHEETKRGYHFDVFKMLLADKDGGLYQNYTYEVFYSDPENNNYNTFVDEVYFGKYDLVVGGFSINESREKKINYSIPLYINRVGILHLNKKNYWKNMMILVKETLKLFAFMIVLGIILGGVLYYIEPFRNPDYKKTKKESKLKKEKRFRRHILTMVASIFGEMGFLSENSSLSLAGIVFSIVCFMIIFQILIVAQARVTTINLKLENQDSTIEFDKINSNEYRPFLAKKGNAESYKVQLLRGKPERVEIENSSIENLVTNYSFYENRYDGVVLLYTDAYQYLIDKNKNFTFSMEGFGLEPSCWIVKNDPKGIHLLEDINLLILKHRVLGVNSETDEIQFGHLTDICKEYIKENNACLF